MNHLTPDQWALFTAHRHLARRVTARAEFACWRHRRDELTVAAEDGILRSFKSWTPDCGASFKTSAHNYAYWGVCMYVRDVLRKEPPTSSDVGVEDKSADPPDMGVVLDVSADWTAIERELAEIIHARTHLRMVRALRNARIYVRVRFQGADLSEVASAFRIDRKAARTVVQRTEVDFNLWKAKARGTTWALEQRTAQSSQLAA